MLEIIIVSCFIAAAINVLLTLIIVLVDIISGFSFDFAPNAALFFFTMFGITSIFGIILAITGGLIV